jgi:trk system potassium uptake protein TrkA
MRIAIAGAGNVGRSIAQELIGKGHQVMLIERQPDAIRPERVPQAEWVLADACELSSLSEADLARCDVVVAATGDDKANLVVSLLAKTEFAVGRVVARVNRRTSGCSPSSGAWTSRCPSRGCSPRWSRRRSASATWCG